MQVIWAYLLMSSGKRLFASLAFWTASSTNFDFWSGVSCWSSELVLETQRCIHENCTLWGRQKKIEQNPCKICVSQTKPWKPHIKSQKNLETFLTPFKTSNCRGPRGQDVIIQGRDLEHFFCDFKFSSTFWQKPMSNICHKVKNTNPCR